MKARLQGTRGKLNDKSECHIDSPMAIGRSHFKRILYTTLEVIMMVYNIRIQTTGDNIGSVHVKSSSGPALTTSNVVINCHSVRCIRNTFLETLFENS